MIPRSTRTRSTRTRAALVLALVAGAALAPALVLSGSTPAQADELSRDTSYSCQYSGAETVVPAVIDGLPLLSGLPVPVPVPVLPSLGGTDTVGVEVVTDVPAKVAPGGTLKLSGTATFTFGPNATATGAATVFDFISDSFGVEVSNGASVRLVRIAELATSRSTVGSPVVTARWALPDLLVPSTATGRLVLSLPHEAAVTNPVSTSPASVAFTGLLRTDSRVQPERAVACALTAGQDAEIGSVAVAGGAGEEQPPASGDPTSPPATTPGGLTPSVTPGAPDLAPGSPTAPVVRGADPGAQPAMVLAAQAIPPQTVADGVRLPPWALLLGGVLIAGGLFLVVSTSRRLRLLAVATAVLALLVAPTPLTPQAPAYAAVAGVAGVAGVSGVSAAPASGQAQVTMLCVYEPEGSTSNEVPKSQPTGIAISLDVPDSVAPGDVVTLTGSASVQAPEDIRSQGATLGFNQLDAISDSFSVGLTAGAGKRQVLVADRWQTGKTAFSNPLVVRAPLYFPAFKVPDDASGTVALDLPRNEVRDRRPPPNSNPDTPARVAVEFLASASGNGTSITYVVSCWRGDSGSGRIASIPVRAASASAPAVSPSAGATTAPGGATPAPVDGQTVAPPGTTVPPGSVPGVTPVVPGTVPGTGPGTTVGGVPGAAVPTLQGAVVAPTVVAPTSQDVVVPMWALFSVILLLLGAYGYAGWNHLRMRPARSRADG